MNTTAQILLVEDELSLAAGIRENLEAEGYSVEHIARGNAALSAILGRDFDLVVLDVMLPEIDGYTICSRAREAERQSPDEQALGARGLEGASLALGGGTLMRSA